MSDEPEEPTEIYAEVYVGEAGNVPNWRDILPDDEDDEDDVSPDRLKAVQEVSDAIRDTLPD